MLLSNRTSRDTVAMGTEKRVYGVAKGNNNNNNNNDDNISQGGYNVTRRHYKHVIDSATSSENRKPNTEPYSENRDSKNRESRTEDRGLSEEDLSLLKEVNRDENYIFTDVSAREALTRRSRLASRKRLLNLHRRHNNAKSQVQGGGSSTLVAFDQSDTSTGRLRNDTEGGAAGKININININMDKKADMQQQNRTSEGSYKQTVSDAREQKKTEHLKSGNHKNNQPIKVIRLPKRKKSGGRVRNAGGRSDVEGGGHGGSGGFVDSVLNVHKKFKKSHHIILDYSKVNHFLL